MDEPQDKPSKLRRRALIAAPLIALLAAVPALLLPEESEQPEASTLSICSMTCSVVPPLNSIMKSTASTGFRQTASPWASLNRALIDDPSPPGWQSNSTLTWSGSHVVPLSPSSVPSFRPLSSGSRL